MIFCRLLTFFKIIFFKNSFRNTIRLSNSLDPDQARHFVGLDLGPNCLQRSSADDNIPHWQTEFICISIVVMILFKDKKGFLKFELW